MSNKLICRTCLKIVEGNKHMYLNASYMNEIDKVRTLGELLEECVSEVNLQLTDSPLMCQDCVVLLKIAIHFKEVCSRTEEEVYNYLKLNDCLEKCSNIDLNEVIKLKEELQVFEDIKTDEEIFNKNQYGKQEKITYDENLEPICRTCLKVIQESNFKSVNDIIGLNGCQNSVKILEECVSLICLQSTDSLLICNDCNEMLENTYSFKQMCCETEEQLYNFMKLHDLHLDKSSNIQLTDVLNLKNKFKIIQDNSSVINQDIKFSYAENSGNLDSSISGQSIPNSPRTKRKASKIANARILNLSKQDTLSDEPPELNRKKSKLHTPKLDPKKSKLQPPRSVRRKLKSYLPKPDPKKSKSRPPNSSRKESKSLSRSRHFKCKKCQYKAYRMDLLIRHKLNCKNRFKSEEEIYNKSCKYCSKKFNRNTHLKRHEYTHTLISNYVCARCGRVFAEKYQLNNHEARHTQGEGCHKCHHCNKSFFRKCDLTAHLKRTVLKEVKFMCTFCNKEFRDRRDRLSHMSKYHTGEKLPFKCRNCSFSTAYSKRFHSHKKKCV